VLERPDIHVVSIVITDHWHVKIAIEALQAGKHVFCQKPLSLTLEENKLARAAAEKFPKLQFFIGTQQWSRKEKFCRAVNMAHKGLLGEIKKVTAGINSSPIGGPFPIENPPSALDWDMWLGQAPMVPFRNRRCHYEFRWWYEYSGGKFTDWGAHHVDIAQWALKEDTKGKGPIEEGWDKDTFGDDDLKALYKGKPFEGHKQNFYRCIREGRLPVSDVCSHIIAMNTCHFTAIAARLGRTIKWDPATETIVGDEQAAAFAARTPRAGFEIPRV